MENGTIIPKSKKMQDNPCRCKIKNNSTKIKCDKVTQENRESIFNMFWSNITWSEKIYIQCLVKIQNVQRRRGTGEISKRNVSLKYHLKVDNTEIRVCKQMFLKTLGMKESTVLNWVDKSQEAERKSKDKRKKRS